MNFDLMVISFITQEIQIQDSIIYIFNKEFVRYSHHFTIYLCCIS